jgi:two-component system, OmpR family, response regulator MtrA
MRAPAPSAHRSGPDAGSMPLRPMPDRARPRILLVEDDDRLGRQVREHLEQAGYEVIWLTDGARALEAPADDFQLVLLDLMLPGAYGMDVLKRYRAEADVPVLILSARQEAQDRVKALQLGADDFLTKPFWPEELLARVKARMRRPVLQRAGALNFGPLDLDLVGRKVEVDGEAVTLTRVEFDLLAALAKRPGTAVPRDWLAEHVLDPERDGTERTLDVHVSRLRKKLGTAGRQLVTVWGIGYRLDGEGTLGSGEADAEGPGRA